MQNQILANIEKSQEKKRPPFHVGDTVTVHVRLKEGDKERIQPFKGVVITKSPISGKGPNATFTVRKISSGVGVERIFALHSPFIEKMKVESSAEIRRSKLYFLRKLKGKKARLKEVDRFSDVVIPEPVKEEVEPVEVAPEAGTEEGAAASAEAKAENESAKSDTEKKNS